MLENVVRTAHPLDYPATALKAALDVPAAGKHSASLIESSTLTELFNE
jgi:hypothetical protein